MLSRSGLVIESFGKRGLYMTCDECKERLLPENPEVPQWNPHTKSYLPSLCSMCNNFIAEKETIYHSENIVPDSEWKGSQWDIVQQLQCEVRHIHAEVQEKKPKKRSSRY